MKAYIPSTWKPMPQKNFLDWLAKSEHRFLSSRYDNGIIYSIASTGRQFAVVKENSSILVCPDVVDQKVSA